MTIRLRVLSYNIHKGFSTLGGTFVLKRIKESIVQSGADLVFLQEVQGQHDAHSERIEDWPTDSQFEFLADEAWPHFAYGKNAVYTEGHHGNAILSKYPISDWENINVSTNSLESRGILHATIEVPGFRKGLHALCLHLNLFEMGRQIQLKRLAERVRQTVPESAPLLIAGDFNDWRQRTTPLLARELGVREVYQELRGHHARSFPSWLPALCLDRIYYRGVSPISALQQSGSPWSSLSDHVPLIAEFDIG